MPGNVDPKPDTQLMSLIHNPEPVRGVLAPFDLETLRDSFTLLPGSPPGFDPARLYGTDDGAAKFVNTVNSRAHANTGVGSTFIPREQQPRAPESSLDTRPSQGGVDSGTEKKRKKKKKKRKHEHEDGGGGSEHKEHKKKKRKKDKDQHEHNHHRGGEDGENGDVVVD
ncbi:hypothetical protein BC938DRAFT_478442 [Jimgerdemannia flammicorona]|uniref:Mediator complex subunit 19 n=1 Tax=Jimgerdemannia flammicorona TaxID=994334 RepID=A0A433QMW3_9FUNG|nr:hypothetical protein BC938DRAFT_478442 [Jimgerdemannia flammicorona]